MERNNLDALMMHKDEPFSTQKWYEKYQIPYENPNMYEYLLQNLKVDINIFLHDKVHSDMTMKQFQKLSVVIYQLIMNQYQKHMREQ